MRVLGAALLLGVSLKFGLGSNASSWQQIAIGGGGYVLQTFFSAVDANVYMKTDVGGVYRRSSTNNSWIPLLDWAGPDGEECDDRNSAWSGAGTASRGAAPRLGLGRPLGSWTGTETAFRPALRSRCVLG